MTNLVELISLSISIGLIIWWFNFIISFRNNYEVFKIDNFNYHIINNNKHYRCIISKYEKSLNWSWILVHSKIYHFPNGIEQKNNYRLIKAVFNFLESEEAANRRRIYEEEIVEKVCKSKI